MANEITEAAFTSNGGLISEVLGDMIVQIVDDQSDLRSLVTRLPWTASGSKTMHIPKLPAFPTAAAASSETSGGFSNTAFTTSKATISIARQGLLYQPTDLWIMSDGSINLGFLSGHMAQGMIDRLAGQITALFASVSSSVGTSGVNLSVDDLFDAVYTLNTANNSGRMTFIGHSVQFNDLHESLRGESGPIQYRTDAQELVGGAAGWGYKGSFGMIDLYQSDKVPTANTNADRDGCLFTQGAFAYTLADPSRIDPLLNAGDVLVRTPDFFIEKKRDQANGMTSLYLNFYSGVVELDDARACRIVTDA